MVVAVSTPKTNVPWKNRWATIFYILTGRDRFPSEQELMKVMRPFILKAGYDPDAQPPKFFNKKYRSKTIIIEGTTLDVTRLTQERRLTSGPWKNDRTAGPYVTVLKWNILRRDGMEATNESVQVIAKAIEDFSQFLREKDRRLARQNVVVKTGESGQKIAERPYAAFWPMLLSRVIATRRIKRGVLQSRFDKGKPPTPKIPPAPEVKEFPAFGFGLAGLATVVLAAAIGRQRNKTAA